MTIEASEHRLSYLQRKSGTLPPPSRLSKIVTRIRDVLTSRFSLLDVMGEAKGKSFVERQLAKPLDERVAFVRRFFEGPWLGYGRYELLSFRVSPQLLATIRLLPSPEYLKTGKTCGPYILGIFKGFFSNLFGVGVKCEETKCAADGYEYCEFKIHQTGPKVERQ